MSTGKLFMPITGEEKRALLNQCLIAAKQTNFIPNDVTDLHNDRLLQLYRQWGGDKFASEFKPMGTDMKVEDAAVNFLNWCKKKAGELEARLQPLKIEITDLGVSMHVPLGQRGMMVFTANAKPNKELDEEQTKEFYALLQQTVIKGYQEYIEHPPQLPVKKSYHAKSGDTSNVFDFTSIIERNNGGTRGFFIKGDRFVKHGVRVWPSTLSAAGIDVETINGEKFIAGKAIYICKADGSPDIVVGITLGANNL